MPTRKTPDEAAQDVGEQVVETANQAARRAAETMATMNRQASASMEQGRQVGWDVTQTVTQQVADNVRQQSQRTREVAQTVGQQVIAGLQQTHQMTLDAVSAWVDAVSRVAPDVSLVPFADQWRDAALANFEFAGAVLGVQREFAENLYATLAPLTSNN